MILLSGHSLTPARKVPLETMSLRLNERESSASMVPVYMTGIGQDSWFQDDTNPGKGIVWRVKSTNMSYSTDTPTVELEHIINTLKDRVMFGEHTAANISGGSECTAEQAVRYILSFQSDWVLGSFGYSKSAPYKFDGDTLFDALEKVSDSLDDPWWSFDTTKYPFVLSINPECRVTAHRLFFLPETAGEIDFTAFDYVADAVDNITAKLTLIECAKRAGVPVISAMGTGNKLDPTMLKAADIYETAVCPLARVMRKECRKRGIESLKVVYSEEEPLERENPEGESNAADRGGRWNRMTPASNAIVPATAGLLMASEIIKDLIQKYR